MRCPASVNLTQGLHEGTESEAAAEGTRAHLVLERALNTWIATGDETVPLDGCDNEEMQGHIQDVFNYVVERYELMPGDGKKIAVEVRISLHYMTMRHDLWGSADVIIWNDKHIDVMDLKYGKGLFVQADTSQNRIYLLGAMALEMKATKGDVPWESVRSTIMQPRYPDANDKTIRFQEFDPNELLEWKENVLLPAAHATDDPLAEPVAGEEQCRFCLAKATCPAVEQKVSDLCSVFEPVEGELDVAIGEADTMSIDKLLEVHDQIPFIEGYLKAVSKRIREMLEARDPALKGKLKLVRANKRNTWSLPDDEIAIELTKGTGRMLKTDLFKSVVISAPHALKLKALKPAQKKRLQEYIVKSEGSLSIVPDSDPRTNAFPVLEFEKVAPEQLSDEGFDFL